MPWDLGPKLPVSWRGELRGHGRIDDSVLRFRKEQPTNLKSRSVKHLSRRSAHIKQNYGHDRDNIPFLSNMTSQSHHFLIGDPPCSMFILWHVVHHPITTILPKNTRFLDKKELNSGNETNSPTHQLRSFASTSFIFESPSNHKCFHQASNDFGPLVLRLPFAPARLIIKMQGPFADLMLQRGIVASTCGCHCPASEAKHPASP